MNEEDKERRYRYIFELPEVIMEKFDSLREHTIDLVTRFLDWLGEKSYIFREWLIDLLTHLLEWLGKRKPRKL
jgi:hypothetical protein